MSSQIDNFGIKAVQMYLFRPRELILHAKRQLLFCFLSFAVLLHLGAPFKKTWIEPDFFVDIACPLFQAKLTDIMSYVGGYVLCSRALTMPPKQKLFCTYLLAYPLTPLLLGMEIPMSKGKNSFGFPLAAFKFCGEMCLFVSLSA